MIWPAWSPGSHGGERLGGLWLAIRGACRVGWGEWEVSR